VEGTAAPIEDTVGLVASTETRVEDRVVLVAAGQTEEAETEPTSTVMTKRELMHTETETSTTILAGGTDLAPNRRVVDEAVVVAEEPRGGTHRSAVDEAVEADEVEAEATVPQATMRRLTDRHVSLFHSK